MMALSSSLHADPHLPGEFTAEYTLKKDNTVVGNMERSLGILDNNSYSFESNSKTTGFISLFYKKSIHEKTNWRLEDQGFVALNYHFFSKKKDKQRKVDIRFDWESGMIITSVNESSWTMPLQPPVYDKLLYQVALMYDLSADRDISTYLVADGGRIKQYQFEKAGVEQLETPLGLIDTVKLIRYKQNKKDKAILWCAPKLSYLPVRVDTYEDDGSIISATIKRLKGLNAESVLIPIASGH